ncbi:hypothetical protein ONS95_007361 [Cadophora gregata]|uniref:uncharacterized protein n=1 Tax=Cadophora gregata TaxID=51156 RepID=UPI0026DD21B1|nr:uncharacterized protein ONS95_007361 [Cadophora gregata]KAK0100919.1 hypothetical protein ONS95_007361 [Cadophora gregata]KAK0117085.1 hypothetical protein ONS96_012923 [Cadophora gregata f. sp. sojae]
MRRSAAATSLLIFALSIISTTYVLLSLTSKRWSIQKYYLNKEGDLGFGAGWVDPICNASKSPFYRCEPPVLTIKNNIASCNVPNCHFYRPYGRNKTSCRVAVETKDAEPNSVTNAGEQECQDVHYTGNLQIAASVFITLSLILLIPLTIANFLLGVKGPRYATHTPAAATISTEEAGTEPKAATHTMGPLNGHKTPIRKKPATWTPYLVFVLLVSLYIGAILQILAQFFGVISMTIIATPTQDQAIQSNVDNLGATPWIIDKALSAYATVAWTSALACAGLVSLVYRTPKFTKLI